MLSALSVIPTFLTILVFVFNVVQSHRKFILVASFDEQLLILQPYFTPLDLASLVPFESIRQTSDRYHVREKKDDNAKFKCGENHKGDLDHAKLTYQ